MSKSLGQSEGSPGEGPAAGRERLSISVIIPAHNEEKTLGICLESLARMTYPAECLEVIVVDNGSTDRTREVAESFSKRLNLKVLEKRDGTISAVRNWGARAARGEIFAFTDADCEVPRDWLTQAALWPSPKIGIAGAHGLIPQNSSWVARAWYQDVAARKAGEVAYVPTLDLLVPRSVFFNVGGFDESIQTNEDFEFCQRVRAAGLKILGRPEIAVVHWGTPQNLGAFYQKQRWHGTHVFAVFLKNFPSLYNARAVFFGGYTLLCLAGIAAGSLGLAWTGRAGVLLISAGALLLAPFLLSLRLAIARRRWQDLFPLTALHLIYGVARAFCLLEVHKWWASLKRNPGERKPLHQTDGVAERISGPGR